MDGSFSNSNFRLILFKVLLSGLLVLVSGQFAFSQQLKQVGKNPITFLQTHSGAKGIVVLFLDPECPMCQKYAHTYNHLTDLVDSLKEVTFIGVFPGIKYNETKILPYLKRNKLKMQVFIDPDLVLTTYLKATITPEVFILDKSNSIIYQGLVDNWFYSLGRRRSKATELYLEDNLRNFVKDIPLKYQTTRAMGCFIR